MRLKLFFTLIFCITITITSAQKYLEVCGHDTRRMKRQKRELCKFSCSQDYYKIPFKSWGYINSLVETDDLVSNILKTSGYSFDLKVIAGTSNSDDVTYTSKAISYTCDCNRKLKKFVLVNPDYFKNIKLNNGFGRISILLHEIGHHIFGHLHEINSQKINSEYRKEIELNADYYAGYTSFMLGIPLNKIKNVYSKLNTPSHYPTKDKRLKYIEDGYNAAMKIKLPLPRDFASFPSNEFISNRWFEVAYLDSELAYRNQKKWPFEDIIDLYNNSIRSYTKSIQFRDSNFKSYSYRGWTRRQLYIFLKNNGYEKKYISLIQDANEDLRNAINLNPNDKESYLYLNWTFHILIEKKMIVLDQRLKSKMCENTSHYLRLGGASNNVQTKWYFNNCK